MGLDKVTDLMFDLEVNALTSKEENYQCLVSPNCQNHIWNLVKIAHSLFQTFIHSLLS